MIRLYHLFKAIFLSKNVSYYQNSVNYRLFFEYIFAKRGNINKIYDK